MSHILVKECHLIVYTNTLGGQLIPGVDSCQPHTQGVPLDIVVALVVLAWIVGAVFSSTRPEEYKQSLGFAVF